MFVKALFFLVLSVLAFARPQTDEATKEALKNLNVNALTNRIEFISNFHHSPISNVKEGDVITINYDPPTPENKAAAKGLVNFFTIAIGTGNGFNVDSQFFMESERLPIPTTSQTYKFQLPAKMENKEYCIVYTPYTDQTSTSKPMVGNEIMESLYETWFPIKGSLAVGSGPASADNTIANNVSAGQAGQAGQAGVAQPGVTQFGNGNVGQTTGYTTPDGYAAQGAQGVQGAQDGYAYGYGTDVQQTTVTDADSQQLQESGSITIAPAFTAFIAILFACFFI